MVTSIMTNADVLQKTDEINEYITSSEVFQDYIEAKKAVQDNQEAQRLLKQFTKLKEKYEEVQRFGKYHPDFQTVSKEVRHFKREMDTFPSIATFKKAENELQALLVEISQIIADAVSKNIKVPTGNPFFDQSGCSGGCGSGGSCSCGSK